MSIMTETLIPEPAVPMGLVTPPSSATPPKEAWQLRLGARLGQLRQALRHAHARVVELERERNALSQANDRASARVTALEAKLAEIGADLAERIHLGEEAEQALRHERELRKQRELERDHYRTLLGHLKNSRWRKLGQTVGLVKRQDWERDSEP
jgi:MoxR-like ATPase